MQLMPSTAAIIARQLKKSPPTAEELMDPAFNLELGARYLGNLVARYNGRPWFAIPAYNAGEGRVDDWLEERGELSFDEFVEEIPFRQTRDYTKRVIEAWQIYHQLYSPELPYLALVLDGQ